MKEKIKKYAFILLLVLIQIWVSLFVWTHQPVNLFITLLFILLWFILTVGFFYSIQKELKFKKIIKWTYWLSFLILLIIFFNMTPKNDRKWQDEVDKIIQFQFKNGKVEVENIRNFVWYDKDQYRVQWETRQYDLEQLKSVDLIVSYFMKGPVAHVFISFGFENGEHLAFSLEVRQESHEDFSVIGGFFRQYELALVVGDENDLIYARSNVRDEDVYLYPIHMNQTEIQMLFLEYLNKANRLNHRPVWYNTLMSNCTTILFDLVEHAIGDIPRDYRVILPGLLPEYLYEVTPLRKSKSFVEWQRIAHINPKIKSIHNIEQVPSIEFSKTIRE